MDESQTAHIRSCGINLDYSQIKITVDPEDNEFACFFRVKDFNICFKRISNSNGVVKEFDDKGFLIRSTVDNDKFQHEALYKYDYTSFHMPQKQSSNSVSKSKGSPSIAAYQTEDHRYSEYRYDEDGGIVSVIRYMHGHRNETRSQYYKFRSLQIDYHPDGRISIHRIWYKPIKEVDLRFVEDGSYRRDSSDQDVVIMREEHFEYDNRGLLQIVRDMDNHIISKYEYDDSGLITRIISRNGKDTFVELLGTGLLFYESARTDSEQHLSRKMSIDNDRVYRITDFADESSQKGDFDSIYETEFNGSSS
jgi:YD repeat-containing protein